MAETEKKVIDKKTADKKPAKAKKPNIFKRIVKYFRDLGSETKKIVWPSKKQSLNNTGIVPVVVVICAVVLTILDLAFNGAVQGLVSLANIL